MLSRYSRMLKMVALILAITTLVSCGVYMSTQNKPVSEVVRSYQFDDECQEKPIQLPTCP